MIEATGVPQLCQEALLYTRFGGQVVVYGVYAEHAHIDWSPYIFKTGTYVLKAPFLRAMMLFVRYHISKVAS